MPPLPRPFRALALAALGLALAACGARYTRTTVSSDNGIEVLLRTQTKGGEPVDRGFSHPLVISGSRMAHILSRIDVRTDETKGNDRKPAIPAELVYDLGDAVAKGLEKANAQQDVVVYATQTRKSLGIFMDKYVTSLLVWAQGERVHIFIGQVDQQLPKNTGKNDDPLPEPDPEKMSGKFRVLPSEAMAPVNAQEVAVDWRAPIFKKATAVQITPTGRVMRRTILMESEDGGGPGTEEPAAPATGNLTPKQLRDLADLEEQRQQGRISETDYQARKREILTPAPK